MSCVCPHCGCSLEPPAPLTLGPLEIDKDGLNFKWQGSVVKLTPTERCMVKGLAASGRPLSHQALIGIGGFEDSECAEISVLTYAWRIRQAFKRVDPNFAALQTVWGFGFRWAA